MYFYPPSSRSETAYYRKKTLIFFNMVPHAVASITTGAGGTLLSSGQLIADNKAEGYF